MRSRSQGLRTVEPATSALIVGVTLSRQVCFLQQSNVLLFLIIWQSFSVVSVIKQYREFLAWKLYFMFQNLKKYKPANRNTVCGALRLSALWKDWKSLKNYFATSNLFKDPKGIAQTNPAAGSKEYFSAKNLPSQNRVTSVRLSFLNRFENAVARLLPKLFHLRQNWCWWESMMPPLGSTPSWPSPPLSQPPSNGYLPSWSRSCPIARPAAQKYISIYQSISLAHKEYIFTNVKRPLTAKEIKWTY